LAKFVLAQGPTIAKTPMINGMPSIAEVMQARLKVSASEATTRSSSAPKGKNNKMNINKRASKARSSGKKRNADSEEES
jgi:hypothetical protein